MNGRYRIDFNRRRQGWPAIGWAVLLCAACSNAAPPSALPLERIADIALPGLPARFDYLSFDATRRQLFIAHMGGDSLLAVDTGTRAVRVIGNMPDVHGVLAVPELGRVYATVTGRNELDVIDADTLEVLATVPTGLYPDGIAYAPPVHKLFVSDESGGTVTVIGVYSQRNLDTIALGGDAGNTQYDPVSQHVFTNVQTAGELVEIDPGRDRVVARYRLEGAHGNHGLYIEPERHLAFIACDGNDRLIVFDLDTKTQTATHTVGAGPDVLAFDTALRLLYVASESGVVSMFREEGRTLVKVGEGLLAPAAHSVAVDAQTHAVYFPLKNVDGRPVLRVMRPVQGLR